MRAASSERTRLHRRALCVAAIIAFGVAAPTGDFAKAADAYLPIVMPITGFLSVEGGSQRNGAVMALEQPPGGMKVDFPIFDTGTSATGAATALDKALSSQKATAAAVTVFGTEMVAMMPVAAEYKVPLLTISGLAKITESGNPYIFRFLPNDREIKVAHARYVVEVMKKTKIALISDTTAYGQGGFALLQEDFAKLGTKPVFEDNSIAPDTKDMSPLLAKVKAAGADVIVLHAVSLPMTSDHQANQIYRSQHPDRQQLVDRRADGDRAFRTSRTCRRLRGDAIRARDKGHTGHQGMGRRVPKAVRHRAGRPRARSV